jgi:hypothetical protein
MFKILLLSLTISNTLAELNKCPRFEYGLGPNKSCTSVKSGEHTTGYNNITLTEICKENEFCFVFPPYSYQLSHALDDTWYPCIVKQNNTNNPRYPGEHCTSDLDCFTDPNKNVTGICLDLPNGTCSGSKEGQGCAYHFDCMVGLYCGVNQTCLTQKGFNESCTNSYECNNDLLCNNGICNVRPFSRPIGEELPKDADLVKYFCTYGNNFATTKSGRYLCASLNQTFTDEYKQCGFNEKCNYTMSGYQNVTRSCECGYNSAGQGYCPQGQDISKRIIKFRSG